MTTTLQTLAPIALAAVCGGGLVEEIDSNLGHYAVGDPARCDGLPYVQKQLQSAAYAGLPGVALAQGQTELELQRCNQRSPAR